MAAAVQAGPIPDRFYDAARARSTVKCEVFGKPLFREDLVKVLQSIGFSLKDFDAIWKTDKNNYMYVTFKKEIQAKLLERTGSVEHDGVTYNFSNYECQTISLRVHWVHATIRNSFISSYFSHFGKIISVECEKVEIEGHMVESVVRIVTLEINQLMKDRIPHIVRFGESNSMLITAPNRLPICLKCRCLGHRRTDCPQTHVRRRPAPVPVPEQEPEPETSNEDPVPEIPEAPEVPEALETPAEEEMSQETDNLLGCLDIQGETAPTYADMVGAMDATPSRSSQPPPTPSPPPKKSRKTGKAKRKNVQEDSETHHLVSLGKPPQTRRASVSVDHGPP